MAPHEDADVTMSDAWHPSSDLANLVFDVGFEYVPDLIDKKAPTALRATYDLIAAFLNGV